MFWKIKSSSLNPSNDQSLQTLAPDLCGFPARCICDPRSSGRPSATGWAPSKLPSAAQAAVTKSHQWVAETTDISSRIWRLEAAIKAPAGSVLVRALGVCRRCVLLCPPMMHTEGACSLQSPTEPQTLMGALASSKPNDLKRPLHLLALVGLGLQHKASGVRWGQHPVHSRCGESGAQGNLLTERQAHASPLPTASSGAQEPRSPAPGTRIPGKAWMEIKDALSPEKPAPRLCGWECKVVQSLWETAWQFL